MLHGPSMVRVGNTAYIDLDMSDLNGPVAAEVTGKVSAGSLEIIILNSSVIFNFSSIGLSLFC